MLNNRMVNIGFGNMVPFGRVVAVVSNESAPVRRSITDARERGALVDATQGRKTRAVIVTDSGHIILSAIHPETIANRFNASELSLSEKAAPSACPDVFPAHED